VGPSWHPPRGCTSDLNWRILLNYFDAVEQILLDCPKVYVELFDAVILNPARANLRLHLRFNLTYLLAVTEAIVIVDDQISYLDYRYHFQDRQNNLIFRYDSTPHFPDLPSFPHHQHLPDTVIACEKPDIAKVLQEVLGFLQ
jgi:Family of unknown function (DUF6516)